MDKEQNNELYYYEYCTSHGIEGEYDDSWETCEQCGDISKRLVFSFSSKKEFIEKYVYIYTLSYYQDDDESLTDSELIDKIGRDYYHEEVFYASKIYNELMERFL